jgi:hypothetical protein
MHAIPDTFLIAYWNILDKCEEFSHQLGVFSQKEQHLSYFTDE